CARSLITAVIAYYFDYW
nr:immunoglobulin heavy chain junction region [Mus musculus]